MRAIFITKYHILTFNMAKSPSILADKSSTRLTRSSITTDKSKYNIAPFSFFQTYNYYVNNIQWQNEHF